MGRQRTFSLDQEIHIAQRYRAGETQEAIGKSLGVIRSTIVEVLRRQNVKTRHHQRTLTPEQEQKVVERFNAGETARQIAPDFEIDHTTISTIVRRCGGDLRRKGRVRKFESRAAWLADPKVRLRKLLQTARANGTERGRNHTFDDALFDVLTANPPIHCACCKVELDYKVYARTEAARDRSPSLDRCDNTVGYVVGNVYIICWRCNRLKNNSTLDELQMLVTYVERHFKQLT